MLDITGLRTLQLIFLPDTCTIMRGTASNGVKGVTVTWGSIGTVACRVSSSGIRGGARETVGGAGGIESIAAFVIVVPALTDVTAKDKLVVGSRTFEVVAVDVGSYETVRNCVCREIV